MFSLMGIILNLNIAKRYIIFLKNRNTHSEENMLKKIQQKKKKYTSATNLYLKLNDKHENINLKFALNMYVPKQVGLLVTPKPTETLKGFKSAVTTPKQRNSKKAAKENAFQTVLVSPNNSYVSTPFECEPQQPKEKSRQDYKFLYQVGSGGFGHVWKVQEKRSNLIAAMKEISKAKVLLKKSVASVINEKTILQQINSNFIINMKSSFQDREYLYMIMEYLRGGDLRYHLCFYEQFTQEQTKFIAANIILALQYIHHKGIIHRDLKPQNLVFQENGYLRITDFGVARKKNGTPGYMAPEVICRMNHSFQADYFALGVILYEMMLGTRPYMGDTRKEIRDKILTHQARIPERDIPKGWSSCSSDFINKLLKRNKQSRLGYNGIQQLKKHQWLSSINWRRLSRKEINPPFIPGIITQSLEYQREMQDTNESVPNEETEMLLRTLEVQNLFKEYSQGKKVKKSRV